MRTKRSAIRKKKRTRVSIDLRHKGLVTAAEPAKDRDIASLSPVFRGKLVNVLAALQGAGKPFQFNEGYRTVDRQQWLYGSGRPESKPYGRAGQILTNMDGLKRKSAHQGDGSVGSGCAADCYPLDANGKVYIPDITDPIWKIYADAVVKEGLEAGYYWEKLKDAPHCEFISKPKAGETRSQKVKGIKGRSVKRIRVTRQL